MRATKDPLTTDYIEKAIAWVNDAITQPQASKDGVLPGRRGARQANPAVNSTISAILAQGS